MAGGSADALTTTFIPLEWCTRYTYIVSDSKADCPDSPYCAYFHLGPQTDTDCMPLSWEAGSTFYYSPGICPDRYTQGCNRTVESKGTVESRAICCPSEYSCQEHTVLPWEKTEHCVQFISEGHTFTYTKTDTGDEWETSTATGTHEIHAYGVQVRWKDGDLPGMTGVPVPEPEPTSCSNTTSCPSDMGLGVLIGICVGVFIAGLLQVGLSLYAKRHGQPTRRLFSLHPSTPPPVAETPAVIQPSTATARDPAAELPSYDMAVARPPVHSELPGSGRLATHRAEMPTTEAEGGGQRRRGLLFPRPSHRYNDSSTQV